MFSKGWALKENPTFRERLAGAMCEVVTLPHQWMAGGAEAAAAIRSGGNARDAYEAYNDCRDEIQDSAREYGQENPDKVFLAARIARVLHGLGS